MINARDKSRLIKIGAKLRELRELKGLSQDQLAARCDIDRGKISRIETAVANQYVTTLIELAKGLEIPVKDLLDIEFE